MKFKNLIAVGCFLLPTSVYAASMAVNGVSPRALSIQSAFTAIADDPSAVFYNPAGLTQINGTQLDIGYMGVFPDINYVDQSGRTAESTKMANTYNLFFSTNLTKPITLGFGVYAPFARTTSYGTLFSQTPVAPVPIGAPHSSNIFRLDFVPTLAYAIAPWLSVGAGFAASYISLDADILNLKETGDGYGFSGQLGVMVKPLEQLSIGLTYRGPMRATVSGTGTYTSAAPGLSFTDEEFDAKVRLPGVLSGGIAGKLHETFTLSLQVDWEMWSYVKSIDRNYKNASTIPTFTAIPTLGKTDLNAEDSLTFRGGIMYRPWKHSEFRAGYTYAMSSLPDLNTVPAIPDFNAHAFSVGYSLYCSNFRADIGYEYAILKKRDTSHPFFTGTLDGQAHVAMVGLSYLFDTVAPVDKKEIVQ